MKQTVLEGREALKKEIDKIAEVAGYLWQNGWAERNGGNITVNITELVDEEIKTLPAISDVKQIGVTLPALKGCYFFCKGTGKRNRRHSGSRFILISERCTNGSECQHRQWRYQHYHNRSLFGNHTRKRPCTGQ